MPLIHDHSLMQTTCTFVTFPDAVPVPLFTVQVCAGLVGCVRTVTAYAPPLATWVANVNDPLVATVRLSPPLSCNTTPVVDAFSERSYTVPPIVKPDPELHETSTFVTLPFAVPLPFVTEQTSPVGCVSTVTL